VADEQRLKEKYRRPSVSKGGRYKPRTGNSHGPTPKVQPSALTPRKKSYGPF
jgi:hypothetical protein